MLGPGASASFECSGVLPENGECRQGDRHPPYPNEAHNFHSHGMRTAQISHINQDSMGGVGDWGLLLSNVLAHSPFRVSLNLAELEGELTVSMLA